uniref:IS110 family transposase n=1 Tax=Clostridium scindens (strain JCM 10418 / VPI 12708) TaxID=29347 RepID=UPI001F610638
MIYVGIDVAKDKHDCFITNSDGEVLFKPFTISNNREGFETLFERISSVSDDLNKVKVGLEATGHYSYNLLGFLLDKGLPTYVINPLHTNLYRKSLSLRKTKTDKVDSSTIDTMRMSDKNLKSYSNTSPNEELKSSSFRCKSDGFPTGLALRVCFRSIKLKFSKFLFLELFSYSDITTPPPPNRSPP